MSYVKKRKGISLVALVITIIVLIILTGTVIATFVEGGIIDRAKEAVNKSDAKTLEEAYNVNYSNEQILKETENTGKSYIEVLEKTVKELGIEKDFEFKEYNTGKNLKTVNYIGDNKYIENVIGNILASNVDSDEYIIYNGYVTNVKEYMTLDDLKEQLGSEITIKCVKEEIISTGTEIYEKEGEQRKIATIIIFGEMGYDGSIDANDYGRLKSISGGRETDKVLEIAADTNHDGYITFADSYLVRKYIFGDTSYLSQKYIARENLIIITAEDIKSGIEKESSVVSATKNSIVFKESKNVGELKSLVLPYMKEIYSAVINDIEVSDDRKIEEGEMVVINGLNFTIEYED